MLRQAAGALVAGGFSGFGSLRHLVVALRFHCACRLRAAGPVCLPCGLAMLTLAAPPDLQAQPAAPATALPAAAPSASVAPASVPPAALSSPATAQDTVRFDILEFVVEGDTLLGAPAIERAVYAFLGPQRSVADAEAARKALEAAYQQAGFLSVSVQLPPQNVGSEGEVRLQVVAATVERLRIVGAEFVLPSRIRDAVPSLAQGSVPNFNELQQELGALAHALPEAEATPVLAAGRREATLAAELKVQDRVPLHGQTELNNKQSVDTVAGRLEAALVYEDLFQRRHAAALNWFVSPRKPGQADIISASYALPVFGPRDRLSLAYTHAATNVPTAVGGATVSRGETWRLRWRSELGEPGSGGTPEGLSHAASVGLTERHLRDRSVQPGGVDLGATPLRYTTLGLGYDLAITGAVADRLTTLQAEFTVSPGGPNRRTIDCFGTRREQFACKRAGAEPRFETLGLTLTQREPLGRWSLTARLQAQLADAPLAPSEQIVFGGADSVRGYYEGEQAADAGLALRLELGTPSLALAGTASASGLVFFDGAVGKRLQARSPEIATPQLGSAGLGLRVASGSGLQASLIWARVLRNSTRLVDGVQRPVSGSDADRSQRWDLLLRQPF